MQLRLPSGIFPRLGLAASPSHIRFGKGKESMVPFPNVLQILESGSGHASSPPLSRKRLYRSLAQSPFSCWRFILSAGDHCSQLPFSILSLLGEQYTKHSLQVRAAVNPIFSSSLKRQTTTSPNQRIDRVETDHPAADTFYPMRGVLGKRWDMDENLRYLQVPQWEVDKLRTAQ